MLFAAVLATVPLRAGVAYDTSKHGHPDTGVLRLLDQGRGSCAQCHDQHASRDGVPTGTPNDRLLFQIGDETLCHSCHSSASPTGIYPDIPIWGDATHATSPDAYSQAAPLPVRSASEAGRCVNCHDPHAAEDAYGVIPSMLRLREEQLCTACHNTPSRKDIAADLAKAWRHPIGGSGRHTTAEGKTNDPDLYDDSGIDNRRHAECADCHNAHVASPDTGLLAAPEASRRLHGVARVKVRNGVAGTIPLYTWRGADDLIDPREYELCFKCHSSWVELPLGKPDLALLTNPDNPSFHPIQAQGKNSGIHPDSFANGTTWDALVWCSDCHGSDDPTIRGPHGSANQFILRRPSVASSAYQAMAPTDLCFSCHRWEVYGDPAATNATQQLSRFNQPANQGHAYHVGAQQVPCYGCHVTHGSTTQPWLIVTGRTPGIVAFDSNARLCTATCHAGNPTRTWTANYGH